jgi:hypothetical protein
MDGLDTVFRYSTNRTWSIDNNNIIIIYRGANVGFMPCVQVVTLLRPSPS